MRSVKRCTVVAGFLGCVLASGRRAQAEPLPIELTWDAPPECPSREEVVAELARITRVKAGRVVTPINAQASIDRAPNGRYRLRLRTQREDQTGDTDLDAATCPVLKRGVTLVLALALGDGVDLVDETPEPAANPEAPPVVAPPARSRTAAKTVVSSPESPTDPALAQSALRWSPWLAATGTSGLIAKPALGAQAGLEVGQARWQALAHVSYWPARSAAPAAGIDSSFSAVTGALGGCGRAPLAGWALAVCATLEVGLVHGQSAGAFRDGSATAPWYAVGPSLVLVTPFAGPLKLRVAGGLSVAFDPPRFAILGFQEVYRVSRYVPALSLGLTL